MRGVFSAGVLDVFMERGFDPFSLYIGTSAGACNLSSHLAGQHGRNYRIYTGLMTSDDFINTARFLRGGHLMDLDCLWEHIAQREPLNVPAILSRKDTRFLITATGVDSGTPVYIEPDAGTCLEALKASSAIPLLYRSFPQVRGVSYTDGGITDAIPVIEAYRRGARIITVIRSRPGGYYKKNRREGLALSLLLRRWPYLASALRRQIRNYARAVDFILGPPGDCRVHQIAPPDALQSSRTTQDRELLDTDYRLGRELGMDAIGEAG